MKKIIAVLAATASLFMLASCGSTKKVETSEPAVKADRGGVPAWVFEGKKDSTGLYAVGAGKMSNLQNSLKLARAEARVELARELKVEVQSVLQTYVDDTGSDTARQNLSGMQDSALLKTDAMLQGSQQVDYYQDKDDTVYVLMYLPYEATLPVLNETVANFTRDPTAAFTEAKMAEAYDKYFAEKYQAEKSAAK